MKGNDHNVKLKIRKSQIVVKITDIEIDSIMSKALMKNAIGHWCNAIVPIDKSFHPECSKYIAADKKLRFMFRHNLDENPSAILTKEKFIEGLDIWLNEDAEEVIYKYGTLSHMRIDCQAADKIIQYALFDEIRYERK